MPKMPETPAVARRRAREMRTVSQMIALHCRMRHGAGAAGPTETAYCGEAVCPACAELDAFAVRRTELCPRMAEKSSCSTCKTHCYPAARQEQIRAVMRDAGPRMLLHHPIAAIRHLMGR